MGEKVKEIEREGGGEAGREHKKRIDHDCSKRLYEDTSLLRLTAVCLLLSCGVEMLDISENTNACTLQVLSSSLIVTVFHFFSLNVLFAIKSPQQECSCPSPLAVLSKPHCFHGHCNQVTKQVDADDIFSRCHLSPPLRGNEKQTFQTWRFRNKIKTQ